MSTEYDEYVEYQVADATMDIRIEAESAKIRAKAYSAKMKADLDASRAHGAKVNQAKRIMQTVGYNEATIQATLKGIGDNALKDMGIEVVLVEDPPDPNKPVG